MTQENQSQDGGKRTWIDEIEVASEELVARVKQLAADNKVKRIRVIEPDGDIAGGAVVLAAPVLAILGAIGAFAAKLKIEIVNEEDLDGSDTGS